MDLHMVDPRFGLSGLLVGLLVGLTGVGGGSLMTPLLVLVFGILRPPRMVPTCSSPTFATRP